MKSFVPNVSIRTPEGVSFDLLLAGIVPRFAAWCIDLVAVMAISAFFSKITALFSVFPSLRGFLGPVVYFVSWIGYGICFEWFWNGQTPGKRLLRLRVVDMQGLKLQFGQVGIRNLLRVVDSIPLFYLVGGISCFLSKKCQRLGDIAASTLVIRFPKINPITLESIVGKKYNSMRDYPHLQMRLRQMVTADEAALALEAIRRAPLLDSQSRIVLFSTLASYFRKIVEFPPEATEMISDEQYISNVVDTIYSQLINQQQQRQKLIV